MSSYRSKPIVTAEAIQARWQAERDGMTKPAAVAAVKEVEKQAEALAGAYSPTQAQQALKQVLDKYEVSPADELVRMALECREDGQFVLDPGMRVRIWTELLSYQLPKLKSAQVAGQVDHQLTVVLKRFGDDEKVITDSRLPVIEVEVKE